MKQRVVTALIGLCLFCVILLLFNTFFFNAILSIVAILSVYELLHAYNIDQYKVVMVISCIFAGIVPLLVNKSSAVASIILVIVYVAILFMYALKNHEKIKIETVGLVFFISVVFTFSIMPLLYIRDQFGLTTGLYYFLLIFACSWGSDSGAYFAGRFFGKRKLSPKISPNKTIEGVFGGVISCLMFVTLLTILYYFYEASLGNTIQINYFILIVGSIVGSLIGVLGDLFASMIKRQCSIKDFGQLMPGHGGLVDRLDSTFFVAPFFFVMLQIARIIV